jgi:hypothetical protein
MQRVADRIQEARGDAIVGLWTGGIGLVWVGFAEQKLCCEGPYRESQDCCSYGLLPADVELFIRQPYVIFHEEFVATDLQLYSCLSARNAGRVRTSIARQRRALRALSLSQDVVSIFHHGERVSSVYCASRSELPPTALGGQKVGERVKVADRSTYSPAPQRCNVNEKMCAKSGVRKWTGSNRR